MKYFTITIKRISGCFLALLISISLFLMVCFMWLLPEVLIYITRITFITDGVMSIISSKPIFRHAVVTICFALLAYIVYVSYNLPKDAKVKINKFIQEDELDEKKALLPI